jgi:hypothetical protein
MGLFGPSSEERHAAAAAAIAPYGFVVGKEGARALEKWLPLELHHRPESYEVAAWGRIDSAEVSVFQYGYSTTDGEGQTHHHDQMVVVAEHPRIEGGAGFTPEPREWSGVAQALDVLLWIPPFTFVKVIQWLGESENPDRSVGHADFDRLYRVRARSDAHAARAIPPLLRESVVRLGFRGNVELRPGVLVYSVFGCRFDAEGVVRALGFAAPLMVGAAVEPSTYR